ncbi:MAG: hypothetical protein ACYC9R_12880 [Nitrosotalea sp.]
MGFGDEVFAKRTRTGTRRIYHVKCAIAKGFDLVPIKVEAEARAQAQDALHCEVANIS